MSGSAERADDGTARELACDILSRVERQGAFASILLDARESRLPDRREAALLHELVLGVLRRRRTLDHALARVARRPPHAMDLAVRTALRIGAYTLLYLDRVPDFAAVDGAVRLVKRRRPQAAGFANAVLRAVAARGAELLPEPPAAGDVERLALYHSHPTWWTRRVVGRRGWVEAERLLAADNAPAATVLRPNLRRITTDALAELLAGEGVRTERCRFVPQALRVTGGPPRLAAVIERGLAWVQDEAAQLVPTLLGPDGGPRLADLCAAPGGKTLQLAERAAPGDTIVACDRHQGRLGRLVRAADRIGAAAVLPVVADLRPAHAPLRGPFDQILLDAPCSGTGTLRRHPEIRWRLRQGRLKLLAARQRELLATAAGLTAPGGRIVYAVCSLEAEEGEEVVRGFLAAHTAFRLVDPRPWLPLAARRLVAADGFLQTSPLDDGMDGFFAARLERTGDPR